jgi:signal peptidase II
MQRRAHGRLSVATHPPDAETQAARAANASSTAQRVSPWRAWLAGPLTPLGLSVALVVCLLDQASKLWVIFVYDLENRGRVAVAPFIDFVMTWNTGISYGLFAQESDLGRWLLLAFTALAAAVLWVWLARTATRLSAVALGLVIGGALGNAIDRAAYGAVTDFVLFHIDFGSWQFRWYVFNLADAAIVAGVIALLYEALFPGRAAKAP